MLYMASSEGRGASKLSHQVRIDLKSISIQFNSIQFEVLCQANSNQIKCLGRLNRIKYTEYRNIFTFSVDAQSSNFIR